MANQVKPEKVKPVTDSARKEEKSKTMPTKKEDKVEISVAQAKVETKKPVPKPQSDILIELADIRQTLIDHSNQLAEIRETISRKRKPVSNAKVQIRDKETGKVYKSKNNVYQSLLKAGELADLVKKGVFGDDPKHNTFGWYALVRELPDRFEEVKEVKAEVK